MSRPLSLSVLCCAIGLASVSVPTATAQSREAAITPVTDADLQDPNPDEWLTWRRTLNSWGHSPLDQVNLSLIHI